MSVRSKIIPALRATLDQSFCTMDLVVLHLYREDLKLIVVLLVTITTLALSNIILLFAPDKLGQVFGENLHCPDSFSL